MRERRTVAALMAALLVTGLTAGAAEANLDDAVGFVRGPAMAVEQAAAALQQRVGEVPDPSRAPTFSGQIAGGSPAREGRWPATVSVNVIDSFDGGDDRSGHFCGGTVIADRWVLTAAHCLTEPSNDGASQEVIPREFIEVVAGRLRLSASGGRSHAIEAVFVSEGWTTGQTSHDIGLLKLETATTMPPVSLLGPMNESAASPLRGEVAPRNSSWVTGWGSTVSQAIATDTADVLQQAPVPIWTQQDCADADLLFDQTTSLCAGPRAGDAPVDACYGDSGGPLMRLDRRSGQFRQLGIVSRGAAAGASGNCAVPGQPTVYTRVASFAESITALTGVTYPADAPRLPAVRIVAGESRFETSVAASKVAYPGGADTVTVATGNGFGDALAGAPAAAVQGGPLLLVNSDELPIAVKNEIERLNPQQIIILGGTGAVTETVADQLRDLTPSVDRIFGESRYDTAAAISAFVFASPQDRVFIATGAAFPDAVTGATAAVASESPLLLVPGTQQDLPAAVEKELRRLRPREIVLLGGESAISDDIESALKTTTSTADVHTTITRLAGSDRYDTAVKVSEEVFADTSPAAVYIATGTKFPDALSAGTLAAATSGPLLLVRPQELPLVVRQHIRTLGPDRVTAIGGTTAVGELVLYQFG